MVQKEVGERFAAQPGGKEYGVLSVLLGVYSRVKPLFTVGPAQFYPQPKVESLVLRIDFPEELPPGPPSFRFLRGLVSIAFQQRRKTLQNSLKGFAGMDAHGLRDAFQRSGIDPMRRPETLSPEEFFRLGGHMEPSR
jgi:16S rRNA (adenine1518-N6/adenine1519-N6)-dimethyltransferase